MLTKYAIIVAGGSGSRMKSIQPKQFLELGNKPIIIHTLLKFKDIADQIILVLPKLEIPTWEMLKEKFDIDFRVIVAEGGETRFDSVKNGLLQIYQEDGLVAVHDAVRPFINEICIEASYKQAMEKGSAVVAVPVKDSVRRVVNEKSENLDRRELFLMQTPQTFRLPLLKTAYFNATSNHFTDDASVFEAAGHPVYLLEGAYENIKITTPEDMYLGEAILKYQAGNFK